MTVWNFFPLHQSWKKNCHMNEEYFCACLHTCTSEWKNSMHGVNCKKARRLFPLHHIIHLHISRYLQSRPPSHWYLQGGCKGRHRTHQVFFGSVFATNAQSRFAIVLLDFVLGLQPKRKTTDGVFVIFLYFWKQCTRQVKGPWRTLCVISKSPSRVWDVY